MFQLLPKEGLRTNGTIIKPIHVCAKRKSKNLAISQSKICEQTVLTESVGPGRLAKDVPELNNLDVINSGNNVNKVEIKSK